MTFPLLFIISYIFAELKGRGDKGGGGDEGTRMSNRNDASPFLSSSSSYCPSSFYCSSSLYCKRSFIPLFLYFYILAARDENWLKSAGMDVSDYRLFALEIRTGAGIFGRREGEEEGEGRGEREKREERRKRMWGVGMTTTIGVTFNSGDRGDLKGEERKKELGLMMTKF